MPLVLILVYYNRSRKLELEVLQNLKVTELQLTKRTALYLNLNLTI